MEYSLFDRIGAILDMITSSVFFVSLFVIILLTIMILVVNSKIRKKWIKYILAFIYFGIMIYVIYRYGSYALSLNDTFVEKIFSAMYFPNLITYISMMIITIFLLIRVFIDKNISSFSKILNIFSFSIIWFLFVLILDVIKNNNIDVYDKVSIYSNESLMILLQASMYVFFVWIGIFVMDYIVDKLENILNKGQGRNNISDVLSSVDVKDFTDEEFQNGFVNQEKMKKENEYRDFIDYDDYGL